MRGIINYIRSCFCRHEMEALWEYKNPDSCCYWAVLDVKNADIFKKLIINE